MVYVIGFLAQLFFSARVIFQWILSERAKKVVSPSIYWILSIAGAYLLFIYGWFRHDFAIIFGQTISYYIYIWNLKEKGVWGGLFPLLKALLVFVPPLFIVLGAFHDGDSFVNDFLKYETVPLWLLLYGSAGQVLFTMRFIYQWYYSRKRKESILPVGFWIISLLGSAAIVSYGFIRKDPVLILGQSVGFIAYIRNIMIFRKADKQVNE